MINLKPAVVLGLYGSNSLNTVRSLGFDNIPVHGIHNNSRFPHALYSKFLSSFQITHSDEETLETLVTFAKKYSSPLSIFPIGDKNVFLLNDNISHLKEYFHIPCLPNMNLRRALEKQEILKIGVDAGFKVPKSQYLSKDISDFVFPLLAKPLDSEVAGKKDFYYFDSLNQYTSKKQELLDRYGEMVIQEFIPGGPDSLYEVHGYLSSRGPIVGGMLQKENVLEVKPGVLGSGSLARSVWIPGLIDPSLMLLSNLKFNNAVDINLKRHSQSGEYYFLEINTRTSANLLMDTLFGVNLPATIYRDQQGMSFKANDFNYIIDKTYLAEPFALAQDKTLSADSVINLPVDSFAIYSSQDPVPFLVAKSKNKLNYAHK